MSSQMGFDESSLPHNLGEWFYSGKGSIFLQTFTALSFLLTVIKELDIPNQVETKCKR